MTDVALWFDPVCPFCWLTSKWLRLVADRREMSIDWRFISLRMLNDETGYDDFPPGYGRTHTAGLRMLRVAAAVRSDVGPQGVDVLQAAYGDMIFERPHGEVDRDLLGTRELTEKVLGNAGLPLSLAAALEDATRDDVIRSETDLALTLVGRGVGTPIIQVDPPDGMAFFGPVISRTPGREEAVELWDHVVGLARFPGFAELKRSLRQAPQLPSLTE